VVPTKNTGKYVTHASTCVPSHPLRPRVHFVGRLIFYASVVAENICKLFTCIIHFHINIRLSIVVSPCPQRSCFCYSWICTSIITSGGFHGNSIFCIWICTLASFHVNFKFHCPVILKMNTIILYPEFLALLAKYLRWTSQFYKNLVKWQHFSNTIS
jgi:hypothetical protein